MAKFQHTPESAAKAVRAMMDEYIPKTLEQYLDRNNYNIFNAYNAAKLVQEQCNGPQKEEPCTFEMAAAALEDAIPELWAEYYDKLVDADKP